MRGFGRCWLGCGVLLIVLVLQLWVEGIAAVSLQDKLAAVEKKISQTEPKTDSEGSGTADGAEVKTEELQKQADAEANTAAGAEKVEEAKVEDGLKEEKAAKEAEVKKVGTATSGGKPEQKPAKGLNVEDLRGKVKEVLKKGKGDSKGEIDKADAPEDPKKIRKIETESKEGQADRGSGSDPDGGSLESEFNDDILLNAEEPLEEEHAYFRSVDDNDDGVIDAKEFKKHFEANLGNDIGSEEIMKNYGKGKNLSLGMTVGSLWRDFHGDDSHNEAFAGIDADGDDKISWDEWVAELFHDQPQQPAYVDGEMANTIDDDVFRKFDKNNDGFLDINEIRPFVGTYMRREEVDAQYTGTEAESKGTGGIGMSYVFLLDFDQDSDNKLSIDEFNDGFAIEEKDPEIQ